MSDISIRVENLSKRYRIGAKEEQHNTFAGAIMHQLRHPTGNLRRLRRLSSFSEYSDDQVQEEDILWALRDVSFEVKRGEVVGVIGRNGAGKSTLLKILSRITHPSSGRVEIYGRVSSLLEVGTGFHPELTGRDNVYLNGTILGMRKAEIDRKFDEIVGFSGIERFIDTPVKRYSSGMGVRLAFSIAAHLEPEVLLIDEVLAVGDLDFQKKCLGKMDSVAQSGRTVLFVSHNMAAIHALCGRGLLLNAGKPVIDGPVGDIIAEYQKSLQSPESDVERSFASFTDFRIKSPDSRNNEENQSTIFNGSKFCLSCKLVLRVPLERLRLWCMIRDGSDILIVHAYVTSDELGICPEEGNYNIRVSFPSLWLKPGVYSFKFKLIGQAVDMGRMRYFSNSYPLSITGEVVPEHLRGLLTPRVRWDVDIP